ncbi:hypothetical protein IKE67_08615 [bacterium]|nr:hypothetical protein [bacterium]
MKKIITLSVIIMFGAIAFADPYANEIPPNYSPATSPQPNEQQEENKDVEVDVEVKEIPVPTPQIKLENPDLTVVEKGSQNFYYDKYGKFIARDKKVNNQVFFYNQVGQLVGKSIRRNSNTYYYNGLNKFIGYCTETECFDEDFKSVGTVPPLPKLNTFIPIIDNNLINPQNKTKTKEDE